MPKQKRRAASTEKTKKSLTKPEYQVFVSHASADVFISHSAADTDLATDIAENLHSAGLETFHAGTVSSNAEIGESIWQALGESRALIAIWEPASMN